MLEQIQEYFLPCLINMATVVYILSKILDKKLNLKDIKTYLVVLGLVVVTILNYLCIRDFMRMLIFVPVICACNKLLFKEDLNKTIISTIVGQIILIVSEMLFAVGLTLFFSVNGKTIVGYNQLIINIAISIISIILVNLKWIKPIYNKLLRATEKLQTKTVIYIFAVFLISINISLASIYQDKAILYILIINLIFFILYGIIAYRVLIEKQNNLKIQAENQALVDNLNEYENLLDYQRVTNHENKNQLLVIQTMLSPKDKKISEYIDEIIKEKREDNETLYTEAKRIPSGGLQGIIYQKMLKMSEKNIKVDLNVSKNIKKLKIQEMSSKLNYDLCRILGVILDNAIEATDELTEKAIGISMYNDEGVLCVEISNCFNEAPNLEKIDEKGYSTKGDGHGYGLPLVKEIVEENKNIFNKIRITQNIFTQIIQIKI